VPGWMRLPVEESDHRLTGHERLDSWSCLIRGGSLTVLAGRFSYDYVGHICSRAEKCFRVALGASSQTACAHTNGGARDNP